MLSNSHFCGGWCPSRCAGSKTCQLLSLASALTLFVCKNQSVSHWATWVPYPFIIYIFCNLDFQFVYRIVLGSSKRAKEEICIAELKAEPRPSAKAEQWELSRLLCP
ncbi:Hypothetical predicted protein [Marmota monax]|uniref:Uncharacterized protein n=1 Tax=Marmota monax TaxID=9995 RepID=A0A5E4B003_MARMO|nr:hypothetical protein GHT09_009246 [Marmota monax]VTJ62109.1 Hypothetical predicted protein [Marmota monax]